MVSVEPLRDGDVLEAAQLHLQVLDMEFLSRFGPRFMRAYYRAWLHSAGSIALVARDDDGSLLGVLLGATDPAAHVNAMVKGHGIRLASTILARAITHPRLAKDLVVTRGRRYARGLMRLVAGRFGSRGASVRHDERVVGEITHVLVHPDAQGRGAGRELVARAVTVAREAGVQELMLVTPPDMEARHFYERLGWRADGAMRSQSGEDFLRYRLKLD